MKTKCPGSNQPVAIKMIAGVKFGMCGCCNRVFRGMDMSRTGNIAFGHFLGTQAHG